jgi:glycosyltransferase involved in cell wall biosynthesis
MIEKPVVSVSMITYKHEAFISEAIHGVLKQKTTFEVELIIADDCSPDNTEAIVMEIIKTHPNGHWIKYFRHQKNIGMQANGVFASKTCSGKYVAICEGDDYWTDPAKLQKQYDFLEENDDHLLCAHKIVERNGHQFHSIENNKTEYSFTDFSVTGSCNGVYTCSMMFRNSPKILDFFLSDWILYLDGGDHLLLLLSTINGHKVKLLNEVMGVYRIHEGGVWSSSSIGKKVKDAIITNRLYIQNLELSLTQKNQIIYGLTPRISQFYNARVKNIFLRKGMTILLKILFIAGPGLISTLLVGFFSNRIFSKS